MGNDQDRAAFLTQVRKSCRIGQKLRELGIRPAGIVRIDSAASAGEWAKDPGGNTKRIAETFRQACDIAEGFGERLAAEGEICWASMHSWRRNVELLEMVGRAADARLSGRYGAYHALAQSGEMRRKTRCCRRTSISRKATSLRRPTARWRTRYVRGRSTFTSRRTTAR